MPEFSARRIAWVTASSMSTSFWASSWARSRRASATRTFRRLVLDGMMFESMSLRWMPISSMPWPERTSIIGRDCCCISSSTSRSSSRPALSCARSLSLVVSREASGATSSRELDENGSCARRGSRTSSSRSSASCSARSCTPAVISALTMLTDSSVRSRIIDSTSRPT